MSNLLGSSSTLLEAVVDDGLRRVEDLLQESVQGGGALTDEILQHLAVAGGKRLRPMLAIVCSLLGSELGSEPGSELGGGSGGDSDNASGSNANYTSAGGFQYVSDAVIKVGALCELTHLASLYHDDVMDVAPSRRGVPSAQMIWGNNRAILAGDVLFARSSSLTVQLGLEATRYHSRTFERLCFGQLNETFGPSEDQDPVDFYIQVLADKTGSLVATAAYLGAKYGGASQEFAKCAEAYAEKIGVAFQLADDVIDLTSPAEVSGKTPGTDLRDGVDTMPTLLLRRRALEGTLDEAGQRILGLLGSDLSSDENLAEVVDLLAHHQVVDETRELAKQWANEGIRLLDPLPDGTIKNALISFAEMMVDRAS